MYILWPNTGQGEISDLVTAQTLLFFLFSSRQMTKKKRRSYRSKVEERDRRGKCDSHFLYRGRENSTLLKGFQALHARPSGGGTMNIKTKGESCSLKQGPWDFFIFCHR